MYTRNRWVANMNLGYMLGLVTWCVSILFYYLEETWAFTVSQLIVAAFFSLMLFSLVWVHPRLIHKWRGVWLLLNICLLLSFIFPALYILYGQELRFLNPSGHVYYVIPIQVVLGFLVYADIDSGIIKEIANEWW
jgi:hypothetical protein